MPKPIKIHREGYKIILVVGLSLAALNVLIQIFIPDHNWFQILLGSLSIVFFTFVAAFFRSPLRVIPDNTHGVISPADGKVVAIEEVYEHEYFKDKRLQLSIFMSPTNVHVNRAPISGEVTYTKYHPGKYLVAWHPKSSTNNERNSVVITNDHSEILVKQIAGKLARRIVNYLQEGDTAEQGAEFGFIKFGSRVDLFLPIDTKINVRLKQKVRGGETILGELS